MWPLASSSDANKLLHHKVEVKTSEKFIKIGWVYTVDPVTHSVVLYEDENSEKPKLTLVFGHSIKDITILQDPSDEIQQILKILLQTGEEVQYSETELHGRKEKLKDWLEQNRLPVKTDGEKLKIADALDILPPYTKKSCQSRNQIILSRVQSIIDAMPTS